MKYSDDELIEFSRLLNTYSATTVDIRDLGAFEEFLEQEFTVQLPSKTIEFPGGDSKEFVILKFPEHPVHIPIREILKKAAIPTAKAVVKFSPGEAVWSVLEVLKDLAEKATWLTKQQFAICRAVLLTMERKRNKFISEKGASLREIEDAMRSQMEEPPPDLAEQVRILTEKEVLKVEPSGAETFYLLVP